MEAKARSTILCVDDESNILDGLSLHLRRRYEVLTAPSGAAGLETIARNFHPGTVKEPLRVLLRRAG